MIARLAALLVAALLLPVAAQAQEQVVAALSQARVAITTDFSGSEIIVFGAVKRTTPIPPGPPLQVIVTVAGPLQPATVRRKSRRFGIWVNTEAIHVDAAPSFYAVAATAPLPDVLSSTEDLRRKISIPQMIRAVGTDATIADRESFTTALIRIRMREGLYQLDNTGVILTDDTLFRSSIALPSNLTEGVYTTRIYLTRNGQVVDTFETALNVTMVGLERWAFNLAHQQPMIYGALSLIIAIAAGWGASAVFRYIRS